MEILRVYLGWNGNKPTVPMKLLFEHIDMAQVNRKLAVIERRYKDIGYKQKTFSIKTI